MTELRVDDKRSAVGPMSYCLPAPLDEEVRATLEAWRTTGKVARLWARDASLWTAHDESQWLDWLDVIDGEQEAAQGIVEFAKGAQHEFKHAVVLGMGGSSLSPEVLSRIFGHIQGWPELHLSKTLFVVSSKSGTTLEPNVFKDYFYDRVSRRLGKDQASTRFVVVTDPGSDLEDVAVASISLMCSSGCLESEVDTPRSRISAWCQPRSWASMCVAS